MRKLNYGTVVVTSHTFTRFVRRICHLTERAYSYASFIGWGTVALGAFVLLSAYTALPYVLLVVALPARLYLAFKKESGPKNKDTCIIDFDASVGANTLALTAPSLGPRFVKMAGLQTEVSKVSSAGLIAPFKTQQIEKF